MQEVYRAKHLLPWIAALATFTAFEIVFLRPQFIFAAGIILALALFAVIYTLLGPRIKTPYSRLKFLATPVLLVWTALGFSLVIEGLVGRQLLAIATAFFLVLFFESIVTYIWRHEDYEAYSLENLSAYALTLTVFLGIGIMLALYVLLNLHAVAVMLGGFAFFALVNYEMFWISKISPARTMFLTGILSVLLSEALLAMLTLPFHFMISAAALTVMWYVAVSLARASEFKVLQKKMALRHLILGGALLIILFSSVRWV